MLKKKEYNEEIMPILKNLKQVCAANQIPFFACFFTDENDDAVNEIEFLSPNLTNNETPGDVFCKLINVTNGFDTIPPHSPLEIDFD